LRQKEKKRSYHLRYCKRNGSVTPGRRGRGRKQVGQLSTKGGVSRSSEGGKCDKRWGKATCDKSGGAAESPGGRDSVQRERERGKIFPKRATWFQAPPKATRGPLGNNKKAVWVWSGEGGGNYGNCPPKFLVGGTPPHTS